ncbi:MAG: tRNA (guanosine(46)-N7)-methyltransferase TrmB [Acutalibacteraceae bacterium]|nr:tRNA (guanosine(46)-N7)-methyltransferase TrmB [Acutalibacteraceae bacterium]
MRMRRKPWARPELEACDFFIDNPKENKGKWASCFKKQQPIHLELGCGKGSFIGKIAYDHPTINYIGVDIKSEVLAVGRRNIVKLFGEKEIDNILLTAQNIEQIEDILSPEDVIERIYINFCNPWGREKHKKRRLTHTRQLEHYKTFLKKGCEIRFKTDDDGLFEESLEYFAESGFEVTYITRDLHNSDVEYNIETEHEKMFSSEGIPIKYCIAVYK